jgi:hypothetical protein
MGMKSNINIFFGDDMRISEADIVILLPIVCIFFLPITFNIIFYAACVFCDTLGKTAGCVKRNHHPQMLDIPSLPYLR